MATDLRSGIVATARSLGMNPLDLATIISYETAGTFDPMKAGPTTQWGRHRGLIQFGEPQAKQHGVDFSSPDAALASQLGEDGAVARYFRSSGWKPGMGMLDAYSTVNAGAPGRYNASDANNGGAPGTVRDKVEQQMADHRRKAEQLLAMQGGPTPSTPAQQSPFGAMLPAPMAMPDMPAPSPVPVDVAEYATAPEPKGGNPLSKFLTSLETMPAAPLGRFPGGPSQAQANALSNVLNNPTVADLLMSKRMPRRA
ncbi:hypothetical protein [Microcystis phage Mae-JY35]